MLKPAYYYKNELKQAYGEIVFNDKYKYWNYGSYWEYELNIEKIVGIK